MLKAPTRRVGGYGVFVRYVDMTAAEAWTAYGLGNGVDSQKELVRKIETFAEKRSKGFTSTGNPLIGCIELTDVITLDDDRFIDPAACGHPFPNAVVKLKYFHEYDNLAARFGIGPETLPFTIVVGVASRKPIQRKDRKGQSAFRQQILRNYGYRCCILGEAVVELLEAAHIQPYINERSNHPQNGLCLRVDLHRLFDEGLISITERYTEKVSSLLAGTSYEGLEGLRISLPADPSFQPSADALAFHRTNPDYSPAKRIG
jgi:putative restriction endonuclease